MRSFHARWMMRLDMGLPVVVVQVLRSVSDSDDVERRRTILTAPAQIEDPLPPLLALLGGGPALLRPVGGEEPRGVVVDRRGDRTDQASAQVDGHRLAERRHI